MAMSMRKAATTRSQGRSLRLLGMVFEDVRVGAEERDVFVDLESVVGGLKDDFEVEVAIELLDRELHDEGDLFFAFGTYVDFAHVSGGGDVFALRVDKCDAVGDRSVFFVDDAEHINVSDFIAIDHEMATGQPCDAEDGGLDVHGGGGEKNCADETECRVEK